MRHPLIACSLAAAAAFATLAPRPAAAETPPQEQQPRIPTLEALLAPDAYGRRPLQQAWSPDGRRLVYVWDGGGNGSGSGGTGSNKALWSFDPETGKSAVLARLADLGEDGKDLELGGYSWSPRGDALLLVSKGDLYLFPLATSKLRRLTRNAVQEETPRFSPDGRRIAFVRHLDLYVLDAASGKETRLTSDGRQNVTLNGVNDWVYGEEIWNREPRAFWWSPDSSRLAYYRFDERGVGLYTLLDDAPLYPEAFLQKYPKSGTPNPKVKIGVADVASGKTTWMSTGTDDSYLARLEWTPRGDAVAIERLTRDQKRLDLLRCAAGDGACSTLLTENWKTWINLGRDFRFLPDGRFLWGSERSGWRRLYLYGADGKLLRPVTPDGWAVTALDAVADDGTWAFVTTFATAGLGAIDRKVARVRLDASSDTAGWEVLTPEPGWHQALVSPRTGSWVHGWSDANTPPRAEVRSAAGAAFPLPTTAPKLDAAALPRWEFFTIPGPDGSRLPGRLVKPAGFDPARRYPVIIYHYGGPGSQVVDNQWGGRNLWHKLMALRGFAVFSVDNQSLDLLRQGGRGPRLPPLRPGEPGRPARRGRLPEEPAVGRFQPPRPLGMVRRRLEHALLHPQPARGVEGRHRRRAGDRLEALRFDLDRALPRPPAGQPGRLPRLRSLEVRRQPQGPPADRPRPGGRQRPPAEHRADQRRLRQGRPPLRAGLLPRPEARLPPRRAAPLPRPRGGVLRAGAAGGGSAERGDQGGRRPLRASSPAKPHPRPLSTSWRGADSAEPEEPVGCAVSL